ncbi:MAG: DUF2384 domain-containing protein [Gammaproteobacteria bacterium]|nr:DUF2384 domain-containing protein [Gammaproteobacteria bacterium]
MTDRTPEALLALTKETMAILDSWKLATEHMRSLLGLHEKVGARIFQKYRVHQAFPDSDPEVLRRAGYIIRIDQALGTTYPTNPAMGQRWLKQKHRRFGCAPMSLMVNDGVNGLIYVLAELDCTFGWELTDKAV